jgi:hypothetical protein
VNPIQPRQLTTTYQDLIQRLAIRWMKAELANPLDFRLADYHPMIGDLLLATQNTDRTTTILMAVLDQARALGKSSVWVEQELTFESIVDGADRIDYLRYELQLAADFLDGQLTDENLDRYNERLHRFLPDEH